MNKLALLAAAMLATTADEPRTCTAPRSRASLAPDEDRVQEAQAKRQRRAERNRRNIGQCWYERKGR